MTSKENETPNNCFETTKACTPDSLPDGLREIARQLQPRLEVLHAAHNAFSLAPMLEGKSSNFDSERLYYNLYQDILQHRAFWFDEIFAIPENIHQVEWATGILGTLATIRRQRGEVQSCLEIMETYTSVITKYQELAASHGTPGDKNCCRHLTYKYNLVGINANSQAGRKDASVKHFRGAVAFEIEEGYNFEEQNFAFMLMSFVSGDYMSKRQLARITDDQIWSVLSIATSKYSAAETNISITLLLCDGCGVQEEMYGDFLCCSACPTREHKASYCSKDCQRAHWKQVHKRECKKTSACKVDFHVIKEVANILVQNFAQSVLNQTGSLVTDEQKKAGFPGLVMLTKAFLEKRSDLNSNAGFSDGSTDPEFLALLTKYFAKQPGYEALAANLQPAGFVADREAQAA